MESVPKLDQDMKKKLVPIDGQPPDLSHLPRGCAFHPRCSYAVDRCLEETPELVTVSEKHDMACWVDVQKG